MMKLGVRVLYEDSLLQPEEVDYAGLASCFAAGPGWLAYPELLDRCGGVLTGLDAGLRPSATDVATLASAKFRRGQTVTCRHSRCRITCVTG